jgi:2-aminoadipate transaminase
VAFLPGTRFHVDGGGDRQARLSFSYCAPAELTEAARRLGRALDRAPHPRRS